MNTREKKNFIHCPALNCDTPIVGSWKDLLTEEVNDEGIPYYKCPNCGFKFTVNDVKVNALLVSDVKGDIFLFDSYAKKIIYRVEDNQKFTDGSDVYVHVPQVILIKPGVKCYQIEVEESMLNKDIEKLLTAHFLEQEKRKGK